MKLGLPLGFSDGFELGLRLCPKFLMSRQTPVGCSVHRKFSVDNMCFSAQNWGHHRWSCGRVLSQGWHAAGGSSTRERGKKKKEASPKTELARG